jgi:hypothetical protein
MQIEMKTYTPSTEPTDLEVTLNIPATNLLYFTSPKFGRCYYSRDEQGLKGEDPAANIRRVWEAIGMKPPARFTSLALRTAKANGAGILECYGEIVLVISPEKIANDTVVVNGDFKSIGFKIQEMGSARPLHVFKDLLAITPNDLNVLAEAGRKGEMPRLIGKYLEARVRRPLVIADVAKIYTGGSNDRCVTDFLNYVSANSA